MKPTDPPDPRGTLLMLLSVLLFATNTLLLRALSLHLPQTDGWMALLYRGAIGMGMVTAAGAWFLFDERFTAPEFAGAALTLFATWRVAASR